MEIQDDMFRCLGDASARLSSVSDPAFSEEAKALAALLTRFRERCSEAQGSPNDRTSALGRKPSGGQFEPKHWTRTELKRLGLSVPFSPLVYVTGPWHGAKKRFHRAICHEAHYGKPMNLELALEHGYKPCRDCGGVCAELHPLEVASALDELLHGVTEIRHFMLGDFSGMISIFDAARIMGRDYDELEKECREAARKQLRRVKGDHYFQLRSHVNVLRYKECPGDRRSSFLFRRQDCVRYSRKHGPLAPPL